MYLCFGQRIKNNFHEQDTFISIKKKKEHKIQIMIVLNRAQDEVILVHWLNQKTKLFIGQMMPLTRKFRGNGLGVDQDVTYLRLNNSE